jgi:uridine kinase
MGKDIEIPTYDFGMHKRTGVMQKVKSAPVVIFEGILSMYDKRIRNIMDLKIFVLTDMDICLSRRLLRDIKERGRDVHGVLVQYNRFVKNSFESYIKPVMKHCDIIIPNQNRNQQAIDFVIFNLKQKLVVRLKEVEELK